jgi:acetyl/propionyl-CoA carboxylase alpha subunit
MPKIQRILIANRGEIACRIIHTCKLLQIDTVAVYSEPDRNSPCVLLADQAVCLGGSSAAESYLQVDLIIAAAKATSADAIHPGYGFLSENAGFARRCADEGLIFIGPLADTIDMLGNKQLVKQMLTTRAPDVPLIPGYNGDNQEREHLKEQALRVGFPLLLKAAAGGGGKGMRVVDEPSQLDEFISSVQTEAKNSFGNDVLLLERYFVSCRHIEIQIFGDTHGNVIHLGERECSIQRRHQKIIEESPAPGMSAELRARMGAAAVRIGKLANYVGAGTVEFLLDDQNNFYFLEVNTRLQVEHRVSEKTAGADLVRCQIRVAEGATLAELGLPTHTQFAHSIECRLYAEDPAASTYDMIFMHMQVPVTWYICICKYL